MIATSGPKFGSVRIPWSLSFMLYRKNAPAPIATMPAARPSRPSMRLIAWVMPSSQSTVISGTQSSDSNASSKNGKRK